MNTSSALKACIANTDVKVEVMFLDEEERRELHRSQVVDTTSTAGREASGRSGPQSPDADAAWLSYAPARGRSTQHFSAVSTVYVAQWPSR